MSVEIGLCILAWLFVGACAVLFAVIHRIRRHAQITQQDEVFCMGLVFAGPIGLLAVLWAIASDWKD